MGFRNLFGLRESTTGHMKQRIGQHTKDELERSVVVGCVGLGSVGTAACFWAWGLILPSVEALVIVPWLCKAWDKLCSFARSNCVAETPKAGVDIDAGDGLCGIELVVRGGGSTPSGRDRIDEKAAEEDNVARALDIFSGAVDVDGRFELSLGFAGADVCA